MAVNARPGALVGARVTRVNDRKLLSGAACYVDDITLPGMLHAAIIRSPLAHAEVLGMSLEAPGALFLSDADVRASTEPVPCVWIMPGQKIVDYEVAPRVARYVGQALGLVAAEDRSVAEDLLDDVVLDLAERPALVDFPGATADGAPLLYPELGSNVVVEMALGKPREDVERILDASAHVVERTFRLPRILGSAIETRGVVARWDRTTGELTVWTSTQAPHHARDHIAACLRLPIDRVRVIAPDVGGGFGTKEHVYPDEIMVCLAAIRSGRPVKWIEDRRENLMATLHARDQVFRARLGMAADGTFTALYADIEGNLGAHPSNVGAGPAYVGSGMIEGPYRFEAAGTTYAGVVTNTTPIGALRGFGMQQACWVRERLVDEAARQLGVDPFELRLKNLITGDELPRTNNFRHTYDTGDYPAALHMAAELLGQPRGPSPDGRLRGRGFACFVELAGLGPTRLQQAVNFNLAGYEIATARMEPDGSVTVLSGASPHGQGLETSLAQLVGDALGVPMESIKVITGDTAVAPYSAMGTIASRSMTVAGGAVVRASTRLAHKIRLIAGHWLECDADDVELVAGAARVKGAPHATVSFRDLSEKAWLGWDLPEGMDPGLEERVVHDPEDAVYSYAVHAADVLVDPDTGIIEVERYAVAHDCGTVVNPMIVDGQIHGGVVQGLGAAIHESFRYDDRGQPLTTTYMDYVMPSSAEAPEILLGHLVSPSPITPGGMKGVGEGGAVAPPAVIGNALAAAVPSIAGSVLEFPLTAGSVWELMHPLADG
jgi:carbon-monoxide dehydrogenase large subunit